MQLMCKHSQREQFLAIWDEPKQTVNFFFSSCAHHKSWPRLCYFNSVRWKVFFAALRWVTQHGMCKHPVKALLLVSAVFFAYIKVATVDWHKFWIFISVVISVPPNRISTARSCDGLAFWWHAWPEGSLEFLINWVRLMWTMRFLREALITQRSFRVDPLEADSDSCLERAW